MKTTAEWLHEIKTVPGKLEVWLERQFIGEMLAATRINDLAGRASQPLHAMVLGQIAQDEAKHAEWVAGLLLDRGMLLPMPTVEGTRYWEPIINMIGNLDEAYAAGALAEEMRLVRIRALAQDPDIPSDIRHVFAKILPDETFHAKAFAALASAEAIERMRPHHEAGLRMLGLTI